jgi:hypothetical protein
MITKWTSNLKSQAEVDAFKNEVLGSKRVLSRLQELLKQVEDEQDRIEANPKIYELPNWDYRQAHLNGFRECLNTVNKIINLDQE